MKVLGEDFVNLDSKKNKIQQILIGNVPEETLKRCAPTSCLSSVAELTNALYLCSAVAIRSANLTALGVTCVINATEELPKTPLPNENIVYVKIPVYDTANSNLTQHFDSISDLIQENKKSGGKTLVHCVAGVSRSATLCLAYLMKYENMSLLKAYNHVKSKRPQIRPNAGFFRQLIEYENQLFGRNSIKMIYNDYVKTEIPDIYDKDYKKMFKLERTYDDKSKRNCYLI